MGRKQLPNAYVERSALGRAEQVAKPGDFFMSSHSRVKAQSQKRRVWPCVEIPRGKRRHHRHGSLHGHVLALSGRFFLWIIAI